MNSLIKNLLAAIITSLVPFLWQKISISFPGMPLSANDWISFFYWVFGLGAGAIMYRVHAITNLGLAEREDTAAANVDVDFDDWDKLYSGDDNE